MRTGCLRRARGRQGERRLPGAARRARRMPRPRTGRRLGGARPVAPHAKRRRSACGPPKRGEAARRPDAGRMHRPMGAAIAVRVVGRARARTPPRWSRSAASSQRAPAQPSGMAVASPRVAPAPPCALPPGWGDGTAGSGRPGLGSSPPAGAQCAAPRGRDACPAAKVGFRQAPGWRRPGLAPLRGSDPRHVRVFSLHQAPPRRSRVCARREWQTAQRADASRGALRGGAVGAPCGRPPRARDAGRCRAVRKTRPEPARCRMRRLPAGWARGTPEPRAHGAEAGGLRAALDA